MELGDTFSYWIFSWYLLYWWAPLPSPKIWLWLGLLYEVVLLGVFYYYRYPIRYTILFIIIHFFVKIVPIWTLRHESIHPRDIVGGLFLFGVYLLYLHAKDSSVPKIMNEFIEGIKRAQYSENNFGTDIETRFEQLFPP